MSTMPMTGYPHDPHLRARIQAFSLDEPGVVFPFSARLARENGWTRPFAERVIEEYRRFVYLAATAGHPVSPSAQVDQAWHLHLTYTRSYWEQLCGQVLGRPFHHEPTKGGRTEGSKFHDWYARTLDSYRQAFGHAPPADVWPPPAVRFAPAARSRHVSDATHWIIRKPRLRRGVLTATVAIGALLFVAACTGEELMPGVMLIAIAGVALVLSLLRAQGTEVAAQRRRADGADGGGSIHVGSDGGRYGDGDGGGGDGDGGCGGDGGGCGGGCGGCGG